MGTDQHIEPLAGGYVPKTPPYRHQRTAFELSHRMRDFFYAMEQRTGKSKVTIDVGAAAFERGTIDAWIVMGPKGVDLNWITDEIPAHLPDRVKRKVLLYRADAKETKTWKGEYEELLRFEGLAILCCNVEASRSDGGMAVLGRFIRERKVYFVLDESSLIKTPSTPTCKRVTKLMDMAVARRELDGTPSAENPLELFAQYRALNPKILGFRTFTEFKQRYAEYEETTVWNPRLEGGFGGHQTYPKLVKYARIDELQAKIAPYTYRVLRADVIDMPAKVYQKKRYTLSDEQRRVYDDLKKTFRAELASGEMLTARNILVRYLRYQQILSNRVPSKEVRICGACMGEGCDACEDQGVIFDAETFKIIDPNNNPRLEAAAEEFVVNKDLPTIVWCRFRHEADEMMKLAADLGRRPVRYDGAVKDVDRGRNKAAFQSGDADFFVGSQAAGGRGLTLSKCEYMFYYSNYAALRLRLQSEDRGEAPGKPRGTGIVDAVAEDTIDETLIDLMRKKKKLSDEVMRDPAREWI